MNRIDHLLRFIYGSSEKLFLPEKPCKICLRVTLSLFFAALGNKKHFSLILFERIW